MSFLWKGRRRSKKDGEEGGRKEEGREKREEERGRRRGEGREKGEEQYYNDAHANKITHFAAITWD